MKLTYRQKHLLSQSGIYVAVAITTLFCVFPFYNAILTSLRTGQDLFLPNYLPTTFEWKNYVNALIDNGVARSLFNSVFVATVTVGGCLLVSITASFALARIRFRGKQGLLFTILCVSMFPQVAVLSGMFELVRFLGLYDSLGSLILSYTTFSLPFTVWVLTTFMKSLRLSWKKPLLLMGPACGSLSVKCLLRLWLHL